MLARKCCVRPVSKRTLTASRFFTLNHEHKTAKRISDVEWEVRTGELYPPFSRISSEGSYPPRIHLIGRAINVLTETLPQFFSTGLVLSVDTSKLPDIMDASRSRKHHALPGTGVRNVVEGVGTLVTGMARTDPTEEPGADEPKGQGDTEPIYSPKIQLVYTPKGFERTLHIQGEFIIL